MKQDYVTFKCLSTKIDLLGDKYQALYEGNPEVQEDLHKHLNNMIMTMKEANREAGKKSAQIRRPKPRPMHMYELQHDVMCYMLEVVDTILYQKTGYITDFFDMCAEDDGYFDRKAEYNFEVVETQDAIEFTYEHAPDFPKRFDAKVFEEDWSMDGIEFKSYKKIVGKDIYVCRVSVSKAGFNELAMEIIDSGELDTLREKTVKLF